TAGTIRCPIRRPAWRFTYDCVPLGSHTGTAQPTSPTAERSGDIATTTRPEAPWQLSALRKGMLPEALRVERCRCNHCEAAEVAGDGRCRARIRIQTHVEADRFLRCLLRARGR